MTCSPSCSTLRPTTTSRGIGFLDLSAEGLVEYITIYGGLELGLGIFFAWAAYRPEMHRSSLILGLALYGPITIFRWVNVARKWTVGHVALGTGVLEPVLFDVACVLWMTQRRQLA